MTTALERQKPPARPTLNPEIIAQVLLGGDLSKLTAEQRVSYYNRVCESLGLNPLTQPFAYLRLNNKEVLYAKKDATEQLRMIHEISIDPKAFTREVIEGVYVVTASASMPNGRTDVSTGAVPIANLKGEALANAMMKAETKAKRRVTLSICGLGMLDETEVESLRQDPPPLIVETAPDRPAPPEGFVYIERIDPKRTRQYAWADVYLSTGECWIAFGQIVDLLQQIAQEQVPVKLTTGETKKGFTQIIKAHRYGEPEAQTEDAAPTNGKDIPF